MAQHKTASKASGKRRSNEKSMKKSSGSRTRKSADARRDEVPSDQSAGDQEVTIDRRRQNRRESDHPTEANSNGSQKLERRQKVNRRRQIDPTTCERDYTEHEVEFMNALDDYKRKSGRMFPTCSEVLEVVRALGYVKVGTAQTISCSAEPFVATPASESAVVPALGGSIE